MPVDFRFSHDLTAFRADVRSFLEVEMAPGRVMGHLDPSDLTGLDEIFERRHHRSAGAAGFLGISAPADLGGGGRPPSFRALYLFEAAYHDAPSIDTAMMLCGSAFAGVRRSPTTSPLGASDGPRRDHGLHRLHRTGRRQ